MLTAEISLKGGEVKTKAKATEDGCDMFGPMLDPGKCLGYACDQAFQFIPNHGISAPKTERTLDRSYNYFR